MFHKRLANAGIYRRMELNALMKCKLTNPRLEIVRDIFIFASLTGMSYIDIKNLTADKITTSIDGSKWVTSKREKTNTPYSVKLLDIPLKLIEKYKPTCKNGFLFPVPANGSCNLRLREIAKKCGFRKYLTFHVARHSFASQVCLSQGVPIESVSRMLGHRDIRTTQRYARVDNEKIGNDMKLLSQRLTGKFDYVESSK